MHAHSPRIFVSRPFLSVLSPLCWAMGCKQIAGMLQQEGKQTPTEHLLGQGVDDMLLQRRVSNCQMWGMFSRCWGNVSLPQLGKLLTSIMAESHVVPSFPSYLVLPKQSASSKLSLNSDKNGMITECSNNLHVNQSTSHYVMQWHIHCEFFTVFSHS